MNTQRVLVVSAHSADWLWRSGGTIAKYLAGGAKVYVVCLTYGARGESAALWKLPGQTPEAVKRTRYEETIKAAETLGVTGIEMWDFDDCMLEITNAILQRLNEKIREVRPDVIITHDDGDNTNPDHAFASEIVFRAALMATQEGIESNGLAPIKSVPIYGFEPSQTEESGFIPQVYVDITDFFPAKEKAMACIAAQKTVPEIHRRTNTHRGWQASRYANNSNIKYAESFSMRFPIVVHELPIRNA